MGPDALLFDLGGVLIDVDPGRAFAYWARAIDGDPRALARRYVPGELYARHERGEISEACWFAALRAQLGLDGLADDAIAAGWNALLGDAIPGVAALLERASERWPLYLFSNTNRTHEAVWARRHAALLAPFARRFVSFELGLRKPEPGAFAAVARAIGVPAGRILFFDDLEANIEGARRAGLQAVHVRGTADMEAAIARLG